MAINSSNYSPRTTNTQGSPRRLFELLEEKQEPFVLEIYLLERGCRRKRFELDGIHVGCCSTNQHSKISSKFLRKSSNHHGKTGIRKSSSQFSSIAKRLYNKIVMVNGVVETKHNSDSKKGRRKDREVREQGRCSTASCSSSTLSNAWSQSDTEENRMCIPASVLDEIDLLQAIPVYSNVRQNQEAPTPASSRVMGYQKKALEDSILSASSLWEMLVQARKHQKHNKFGSNSFPRYMNSKKRLQKTRQLLFDCVREVVEHTRNGTEQGVRTQKGQMGPEDIGKIIRNNLKSWGRISAHGTGTKKLLRMDLLSSADAEWNSFEECKPDMAMEIGDDVLEGITDEIVRDMFDV